MLSRYLIAPLIFVALIFLYLAWEDDSSWSYYLIPCILGAAVIYVFSPQIDWWWYHRTFLFGLRKSEAQQVLREECSPRTAGRVSWWRHSWLPQGWCTT